MNLNTWNAKEATFSRKGQLRKFTSICIKWSRERIFPSLEKAKLLGLWLHLAKRLKCMISLKARSLLTYKIATKSKQRWGTRNLDPWTSRELSEKPIMEPLRLHQERIASNIVNPKALLNKPIGLTIGSSNSNECLELMKSISLLVSFMITDMD